MATTKSRDERASSLLNLILTTDSAALAFLLIVRSGAELPCKLPCDLGPHFEFIGQVLTLAGCALAVLILRILDVPFGDDVRFHQLMTYAAMDLSVISLIALISAGLILLHNPGLLSLRSS